MIGRAFVALTATTAVAFGAAAPAGATPLTTGASAYSSAAWTGTANLATTLSLSGSLGKLLDPLISPIVNDTLNPLVAALQGSVNTLASSLLGAAGPLQASTSATQAQYGAAPAAFPSDTTPSPCTSAGAQPCYALTTTTAVSAAPLATANVGPVSGWVEQVAASADSANPVFGRARVANASVTVLPALPTLASPAVSVGATEAKANCPNAGSTTATASASAANVSVLNGMVRMNVVNGQVANLVVNGTSYASLAALPTVTVGSSTVSPYGNSVLVTVPIDLTALFAALGLASGVVGSLTALSPTGSIRLSLIVGPNSTVTKTTAAVAGVGIGVDLSGAIAFPILGLVTATVSLPTGISGSNFGNLLDLRLASTTCQSGSSTTSAPRLVPPALV